MPVLRKLSRDQRKFLIGAIVAKSDEPMRIIEIARAMNIRRSPYLCELIDEMVIDGYLAETAVEFAPEHFARAYIPSPVERVH